MKSTGGASGPSAGRGNTAPDMSWKRVNVLGMGLTAALTGAVLFTLSDNGGGLDEFRMINTLLLVAFSFVALSGIFSAVGARFLGLRPRSACLLAVGLAWLLSAPLAALVNMGGATAEAFELETGDWAWALLPALAYVLPLGIGALAGGRNPV